MELLNKANEEAESAEVFKIESHSFPVKFESGELESVKGVETTGAALRIIKEGKLGFSSTTNWSEPDRIVTKAVNTAKLGEEAGFKFPGSSNTRDISTFDPEVSELAPDELIDYGEELVQRLNEFDDGLELNLDLNKSVEDIRVVNSNGLDVKEKRTGISLSLEVKDVSDDDIFSFMETEAAQKLDEFDPARVANRTIQKLKWARAESEIESGSFPIAFTPRGALVLLVPLLVGFNGKYVYQGASPLDEKLGSRAFSDALSLIDHGSVEDAPSRRSFDDEGLPVEKTTLIEEGRVDNFLYDLQTAGLAGEKPTGNGLKGGLIRGGGFSSPPSTSPTSLLVKPGDKTVGEMISNMGTGLIVDQVLGLGQGNALSGEFSNNVSVAYKVEDGEITGKVKNTMIAGNVYELLNRDIQLGKEPEWVMGGLKTPQVVVPGVNVVQKD